MESRSTYGAKRISALHPTVDVVTTAIAMDKAKPNRHREVSA
jgi:hypothetical protein